MDYSNANNRQRPCRMIMRHVKALRSLGQFRIVRAQVPPYVEEIGLQNYIAAIDIHLYGVTLKMITTSGEHVTGLYRIFLLILLGNLWGQNDITSIQSSQEKTVICRLVNRYILEL
ncbi:hypothetical protein TNCV_572121 [Trichonephila clavipes]|nr:hypothetical protein TNCV_572121 [Trichonephila clavipes]